MKHILSILWVSLLIFSGCASAQDMSGTTSEPNERKKIDLGYTEVDADQSAGSTSTEVVDEHIYGPNMTLADILQRTPGVFIQGNGGSARAFIRGISSIYGANEPLFVIDNIAIGNGLSQVSFLNPRDIEKVTVLKGASTTTLYGARGVNGVILIRTKRG